MINEDVLNITFESKDLGETTTIRQYLLRLLTTLWDDEDSFSGKRPYGNSGWKYEIYYALAEEGYIEGERTEDGGWDDMDIETADKLISEIIAEGL